MAGYKIERISQDMIYELSRIMMELKDPRISKLLAIVKLNLSNDMSHCKVYVSTIEGFDRTKQSVEGLKSATGFIKRELSKRLHLRKCPDFIFVADNSIEYASGIQKMLEELPETKSQQADCNTAEDNEKL